MITSTSNPQVKMIRKLKGQEGTPTDWFILHGRNPNSPGSTSDGYATERDHPCT